MKAELKRYLKKYRFRILAAVVSAVLSCVFSVLQPWLLGEITTGIFEGIMAKLNGTGAIDPGAIAGVLRALVCCALLSSLSLSFSAFLTSFVSAALTYAVRDDVSKKLFRLPLSYFEKNHIGEIQSRVTSDVDDFGENFCQGMMQLLSGIIGVTGIVVMLLRISAVMTGAAALLLLVSGIVIKLLSRRAQKHTSAYQEAAAQANGYAEEMYSGRSLLRVFGREGAAAKKYKAYSASLYEETWRADFYSGLMRAVMQTAQTAGYVLTVLLGGAFALREGLAIGEIQAFFHYIKKAEYPAQQLARSAGMVQLAQAAWLRIREFLSEGEEPAGMLPEKETVMAAAAQEKTATYETKEQAAGTQAENMRRGEVRLEHVTFAYQGERPVLSDFSAFVPAGTRVAITGCTGAGKTTIVKLLMRFYDVQSGAVYVNGRDVREYERRQLRACFGMVLQEVWLFEGSILDNIRYGRPDATAGEVQAAAEIVGADEFIRRLPNGYDTVPGENGGCLSQGQKQLLTIARAFLTDPEILILDEATSFVDTVTEQKIHSALEVLMRGRTCFIIAHRPGTIRSADMVIPLEPSGAAKLKSI